MQFLDFEIEVTFSDTAGYVAEVVHSPAGESAPQAFSLPFSSLELENYTLNLQNALLRAGNQRRRVLSEEAAVAQDLGQVLFDTLLSDEIRGLFYESKREAFHQGAGLRLKLHIAPAELATLPWEFLYDSRDDEYISLSRSTPIVRYMNLATPIRPLTVTPPLHILAMVASPSDLDPLDIQVERERLNCSFGHLEEQGLVKLDWLEGQTWHDLQEEFYQDQYHVFHFVGHGYFDESKDEGFVVFVDDNGRSRHFSATNLARLLADQNSLRLCVLNSCEGAKAGVHDSFSSTAATLVRRGIPAVIAMQYDITDEAAIQMAGSFYSALAGGLPVDAALAEARKGISFALPGSLEWGTPVLFMRSDDGRIFDIDASALPEPDAASPGSGKADAQGEESQPSKQDSATVPSLSAAPMKSGPSRGRAGVLLALSGVMLVALIGFGLFYFGPLGDVMAPPLPPSLTPTLIETPSRTPETADEAQPMADEDVQPTAAPALIETPSSSLEDTAITSADEEQPVDDEDIQPSSTPMMGETPSPSLEETAIAPADEEQPVDDKDIQPSLTSMLTATSIHEPAPSTARWEGFVEGKFENPPDSHCDPLLKGGFNDLWCGDRQVSQTIGKPQSAEARVSSAVGQEFDNGLMIWLDAWNDNPKRIYVLNTSTDKWSVYEDTYEHSSPSDSCPQIQPLANSEKPLYGFGKTWCANGGLRQDLGPAKDSESKINNAVVQIFEHGLMIWLDAWNSSPKKIYLLYE